MITENTEEKQGSHLYKPGQSGNPAGRPVGSLNKATLAAQTLLDSEAENLTRKCIEAALGGDMTALKLCLERICPVRRERPISVKLPNITDSSDLPMLTGSILNALCNGEVESSHIAVLTALSSTHMRALEMAELDKRIKILENKQ